MKKTGLILAGLAGAIFLFGQLIYSQAPPGGREDRDTNASRVRSSEASESRKIAKENGDYYLYQTHYEQGKGLTSDEKYYKSMAAKERAHNYAELARMQEKEATDLAAQAEQLGLVRKERLWICSRLGVGGFAVAAVLFVLGYYCTPKVRQQDLTNTVGSDSTPVPTEGAASDASALQRQWTQTPPPF